MITREQLMAFGMEEPQDGEHIAFPLAKSLSRKHPTDSLGAISLCVTRLRNVSELCLLLPNGAVLYLNGVESVEELEVLEKAITGWEPGV